jgi:hypothetical protein
VHVEDMVVVTNASHIIIQRGDLCVGNDHYVVVTNAMRRTVLRPGDWAGWQPHVRRSLRRVTRISVPFARGHRRFAGLVVDRIPPGRHGRIQVHGVVPYRRT